MVRKNIKRKMDVTVKLGTYTDSDTGQMHVGYRLPWQSTASSLDELLTPDTDIDFYARLLCMIACQSGDPWRRAFQLVSGKLFARMCTKRKKRGVRRKRRADAQVDLRQAVAELAQEVAINMHDIEELCVLQLQEQHKKRNISVVYTAVAGDEMAVVPFA